MKPVSASEDLSLYVSDYLIQYHYNKRVNRDYIRVSDPKGGPTGLCCHFDIDTYAC